tara:strand:- start:1703 stop:2359 length:657 start_codon:yes stop_codon:yes gene_type:complete
MMDFNHEERDYFRSDEEWYFSWWLDDLLDEGFIDDWSYEEEVFDLAEPFKLSWSKKMKTKTTVKPYSVLQACTYQPDFKIYWNNKAKGLFYQNMGEEIGQKPSDSPYFLAQENITRIEIKPNHDFQNKTAQAVIKIKWLMQLGTWCQLVIPSPKVSKGKITPKTALFNNTFVPRRYIYTDKSRTLRKINYKFVTLKEWVDIRQQTSQTRIEQDSTKNT